MLKNSFLALAIISLLSFTLVNNFRALVIEKLAAYTENYPEKIYVQTDKPYYTLGEDLWFTAYLVNGTTHKPSNLSNVIYVELIDSKDSIVQKRQLLIKDFSSAGDFTLKKDWSPGKYRLRAYSNYMRNQNPDFFFQTEIPIWDPTPKKPLNLDTAISAKRSTPKDAIISKPNIGFYPEGGDLVTNIPSKIAIKIQDKLDPNLKLKGLIKDSNAKTVASFETYKFGLGIVKLTPEPNTTYYASVSINGKTYTYDLPKALPEGYNLDVSNIGKKISIQINTNTNLGLKNTFLVVHQRGHLVYEKLQDEAISSYKIALDTKFLQDGVTHITLFNNSGKPVCERLVYVDNPVNSVKVNLSIDNNTPHTEEDVHIQIGLNDPTGTPLYGNLSMSVTDIDVIDHDTKNETIKTYLLLNSDLKGTIETPGYFFQKENDYRRRFLLDLLMLTQGWRRFTWQELLYQQTTKNINFEAEKGIYISGRTTALGGGRQQISVPTRLTIMGNTLHQERQTSNTKGEFKYGPFIFSDTLNILLEARRNSFSKKDAQIKTNRDVTIYLNNTLSSSPKLNASSASNTLIYNVSDTTKITNYLKTAQNNAVFRDAFLKSQVQLQEVIIKANKASVQEKRTQELNEKTLYGVPNQRLDLSENETNRIYNIIDLLNQIPSVQANNDRISIRGQGTPALLLDGFNVEFDAIEFLTGEDIEFIDVLAGPRAAFFRNSANGVIAIYSREGGISSNANIKRKPGIIDFTANGFYTARTFYSEGNKESDDFSTAPQKIKSTLHWDPKIVLSPANTGQGKTTFKTTNRKSNYAIKIEGITTEGIPFFHFSTIQVD